MREYPVLFGDTVMVTFMEYRSESPDVSAKEHWKLASRLHRSTSRIHASINRADAVIPFQKDENWD